MSIGQYMESALEFMSDPLFIKNMNMLVDFRDCYSASFHMELKALNKFVAEKLALEEPVKVDVVVSTPNVQLLAKLLRPMAKFSKMYIQDFEDINLALDYLEIEDEHKVGILKNLSELKLKNRL